MQNKPINPKGRFLVGLLATSLIASMGLLNSSSASAVAPDPTNYLLTGRNGGTYADPTGKDVWVDLYVGTGGAEPYKTALEWDDYGTLSESMLNRVQGTGLTAQAAVTLPARYNTLRDDMFISARTDDAAGGTIPAPKIVFDAESSTSNSVGSKTANPNEYIDGVIVLHATNYVQSTYPSWFISILNSANSQLANQRGAKELTGLFTDLVSDINPNFPRGLGAHLKLIGFYRNGLEATLSASAFAVDETSYTATDANRLADAKTVVNVTADITTASDVSQLANGVNLGIEVTRPTITDGDNRTFYYSKDSSAAFNDAASFSSITITDNGIKPAATSGGAIDPIGTANAESRTVVFLREKTGTPTAWSAVSASDQYNLGTPGDVTSLKAKLDAFAAGTEVELLYTYAGADADSSVIGALPSAAINEKGAYAVPLLRTLKIVQSVPLYRFYNSATNAHFYTADEAEKNYVLATWPQFSLEGIAARVIPGQSTTDPNQVVPQRFYLPGLGVHFYTADTSEVAWVKANLTATHSHEGFSYVAFQRTPDESGCVVPGTIPFYRFQNHNNGTHFYTADEDEKTGVIGLYDWASGKGQYELESVAYCVLPK
ncbi:MAG: hypothetical protein LBM94_04005 [Propionibacteriaceae bacterium]|jgi:hypothetical protein|nr:hypothetical protein [Propionibacteriaceae bacterium]